MAGRTGRPNSPRNQDPRSFLSFTIFSQDKGCPLARPGPFRWALFAVAGAGWAHLRYIIILQV